MRWLALLMLFVALATLGCANASEQFDFIDDQTSNTTTSSEPPACECVGTAPGTYTGPSIFWRGKSTLAPDCPDLTPLRGVEGFLIQPSPQIDFVRECRVTPSDTCELEGEVCVPIVSEDYANCIHHDDDTGCPEDYDDLRDVVLAIEDGIPFTFTLCCRNPELSH
jgi:hypothetical protein